MSADAPNAAEALIYKVKQRIESRYRRILFVHRELAKLNAIAAGGGVQPLDAAAKSGGAKPDAAEKPGTSFEDFVFSNIDFSVYKKIDAEEFRLLFDEGLADFGEAFFQKAFKMSREAIRKTIAGAYLKVGPFYVCKSAGPLLLSIMRTVHSSLEFAPLLEERDLEDREQFRSLIKALNGVTVRHDDGMETRLFVPGPGAGNPGTGKAGEGSALCGTFYPFNKAYTITLIPGTFPLSAGRP